MRDPCENVYSVTQQWRSQDLEVGGHRGLRDGSPSAGSRVRAPGGRMGVQGARDIADIWLPDHTQFCVLCIVGTCPPPYPRSGRVAGIAEIRGEKLEVGVGYRIILAEQITLECVFQLHSTFRN